MPLPSSDAPAALALDETLAPPPGTAPPSGFPAYTHQQILRVVTGIMLCILLAALDQTVVVPAVPAIARDLDAFGHLSWIVSAYLLTSTAATPIYGKLSDIYGRRMLLLPALALFIAASVLCALARSLPQLIVFRALQGLGGAGLMAMAQAAVADVVSPRERGRYQGYMASMWGVASIAGPVVGGWVTQHLSWHYVFWVNLPLGLAAMVLCNRGLKVLPVRRLKAQIDYVGAALLTAGVTAWLLVLSWGGTEYPWGSAPVIGLFALGMALFGVLYWHERRVADPILPPRLFANPVFLRGVVLAFFTAIGLLGATFLLPLFFQLVRGADPSASGFLVVPFMLANVVGAYTGGQWVRRSGRMKGLILVGLSATTVAFAVQAMLDGTSPFILVLATMIVIGMGIGVCMPSVLVMVQNAAERRDVGAATGSFLFLRSMGGAFGSTLVGALLTVQFSARMAAAGAGKVDLGAVGAAGVPSAVGQAALASGFSLAFGVCCALSAVSVAIAFGMQDIVLRSSGEPPAAIGH